jgi:hypothetical protein
MATVCNRCIVEQRASRERGNSLIPADLAVRLYDRRHSQLRTIWTTASIALRKKVKSGIRGPASRHLASSACYMITLHHWLRCEYKKFASEGYV